MKQGKIILRQNVNNTTDSNRDSMAILQMSRGKMINNNNKENKVKEIKYNIITPPKIKINNKSIN